MNVCKRALFVIFILTAVSGCKKSPSDDQAVASVASEEIVWEDLRIQKLLPDYLTLPAIEPCLPANFVAFQNPKRCEEVYWGDKDDLETFFEKGPSHLKSAIIRASISLNVAQIDENSFSNEDVNASQGLQNAVYNKWKWGTHPVRSLDAIAMDREAHIVWIGLNYYSQVLCVGLIYPEIPSFIRF